MKKYTIIGASVYLNTPDGKKPYGVVAGVDTSTDDARLFIAPHEGNNMLEIVLESEVEYPN